MAISNLCDELWKKRAGIKLTRKLNPSTTATSHKSRFLLKNSRLAPTHVQSCRGLKFRSLPIRCEHGVNDWTSAIGNVRVQFGKLEQLGFDANQSETDKSAPDANEADESEADEHDSEAKD